MDVSPSAVVPVTPRPKSDASIETHFGAFGARTLNVRGSAKSLDRDLMLIKLSRIPSRSRMPKGHAAPVTSDLQS